MYELLFQHLLYLTNESYPRGENRRGRGKGTRAVRFLFCVFYFYFIYFIVYGTLGFLTVIKIPTLNFPINCIGMLARINLYRFHTIVFWVEIENDDIKLILLLVLYSVMSWVLASSAQNSNYTDE